MDDSKDDTKLDVNGINAYGGYVTIPLDSSHKLRDTNFSIIHISSRDSTCPSDKFVTESLKLTNNQFSFETLVDRSNLTDNLFDPFDVILLSVWNNVDQDRLGNLLADAVDKGKNVVIVMFSASAGHQHAQGRFLAETYNATTRVQCQSIDARLGTIHKPNHAVMTKVTDITIQSDKRRSMGKIPDGEQSNVDRIADWNDGNVLIAVRHNKIGLVTEITVSYGDGRGAATHAKQLLNNALRLQRNELKLPMSLVNVIANSNIHILQRIQQQFESENLNQLQKNSDFGGFDSVYNDISSEFGKILSTAFDKISKQIQNGTHQQTVLLEKQKSKILQKMEERKSEDQEMGIPQDIIQETQDRLLKYTQRLQATIDKWKELKKNTDKLILMGKK